MNKWTKVFLVLNIALLVTTLASYLSFLFDPGKFPVIALMGLSYSLQIILHLLFILLWIFMKSRYFSISFIVLLFELFVMNHIISVNYPMKGKSVESGIHIATYNMQFSKSDIFSSPSSLSKFLKDQDDLDVMCVQECGERSKELIDLEMSFPYRHISRYHAVGIYSKYPIINKGMISNGFTGANTCLWADIVFYNDTIRIYSTHLESNRHDGIVPAFINETEPEQIKNTDLLGIVAHYPSISTTRTRQAEMIQSHIRVSPHKTILCGDLNDVPTSRVYHVISRSLKDSFKERGQGIGSTLASVIPGIRIDYLLIDRDISIISHRIMSESFSDHYLIRSEIFL